MRVAPLEAAGERPGVACLDAGAEGGAAPPPVLADPAQARVDRDADLLLAWTKCYNDKLTFFFPEARALNVLIGCS